ncbi:hypothetical protein [Maridesulfovibrio sp.]|uniref:hypothetical protein n=1 Tax=Maridesulfovibrio sp. TaxID=2795000 RepID=UPI0039EEC152
MVYRFLVLTILMLSLAACTPVIMNGEVTSDNGDNLGPVEMSAFKQRGLKTYTVKAQLPDETVFSGEMKFNEKSVTLFSHDGLSMNCDFKLKNPAQEFEGGGTGTCTTSDGQKLKVKF